jgi:hypothetical protein
MARERYVWDRERCALVPAAEFYARRGASVRHARSDLPTPMLMSDVPEHINMATGEMVTSRSQHREILRRHGLVEVGNEPLSRPMHKPAELTAKDRDELRRDIADAIENPRADLAPADGPAIDRPAWVPE